MGAVSAALPQYRRPSGLQRLIMRRSLVVAAVVLGLALAMALWRTADDIADENAAALALAQVVAQLATLPAADATALARLQALQDGPSVRHLEWQVHADDGRLLLRSQPRPAEGALWRGLLAAHRAIDRRIDQGSASWPVAREGGRTWTVTLIPSAEAERREALSSVLEALLLLLLALVGWLAVMRWNLRHALAPLGHLLASIRGIEANDLGAVQRLPPMPVAELATLAAALRHLGQALGDADAQRRLLSAQVVTLQEDERARLARELHDEFGQRLTAMRVDARWLARQLQRLAVTADAPADRPPVPPAAPLAEMQGVVDAWAVQCAAIQHDIRSVLARLDPFPVRDAVRRPLQPSSGDVELDAQDSRVAPAGAATALEPAGGEPLQHLQQLLQALVKAWGSGSGSGSGRAAAGGPRLDLVLSWRPDAEANAEASAGASGADGADVNAPHHRGQALAAQDSLGFAAPDFGAAARPWPTGHGVPQLPRALALTLYRISQEALTNVARHAQASRARLGVQLIGPLRAGERLRVVWWVADDGLGLRAGLAQACQRGSGLAGLRDRVWAQGAELQLRPAVAADFSAAGAQPLGDPSVLPASDPAVDPARAGERPGLWLGARFDSHWLP